VEGRGRFFLGGLMIAGAAWIITRALARGFFFVWGVQNDVRRETLECFGGKGGGKGGLCLFVYYCKLSMGIIAREQ